MIQPTQQTITTVVELPPDWAIPEPELIVPVNQESLLRDGGAIYLADFISPDEESNLLSAIDAEAWREDLQRRVQHYGYRYDYTARHISDDDQLGLLPSWVKSVCTRLVQQNIFFSEPDQLIVNEYEPGQGIAPHTDRNCFGPVIASLSLGSDCMMNIMPNGKCKASGFDIVLRRRSLVVFQGASREVWQHSIALRKNDKQNGCKIPRKRRVSLTFRTVV
ncbi:MAG: alpha-ketoglutarate-dependent dioxygenase AlkB [Gammaproteobacteria bacterium]|nr:alpha-ketoglutarate-dependent dioxygenase AlkB [Gammaproteobacteria bacterium]